MSIAVRGFEIWRFSGNDREADRDRVAVELPLEVRLESEPFSVIMRTPGDDRHLALGFLLTEGVIANADDVVRLDLDEVEHVVNIWLRTDKKDAAARALGGRRRVAMNASCGMCGRRSLEALAVNAAPFAVEWTTDAGVIRGLPAALGAVQAAFTETGGLHAAGLFGTDGTLIAAAEDVGRHNAVDKLLGRMLADRRLPADRTILFVSGRSSFEIVQKAWVGGIRLIAAVSAPSSLAVDLAREAAITLIGFVRDGRFNVYANPERIA